MRSSLNQFKIGALMSYIAIFINIITGLLYTPWMIKSIGRENFGLYTLSMSVITLFVFDFGLSSAVSRFISKYLAEGRQDKANDCLGLVYKLYLAIDVILFVILLGIYFFIPQIYKELTLEEVEKFKIIYSIAAIYSVISFPFIPISGILNAHEKFVQIKVCDVLHKLIIVGTMSFCLLFGYGLYALVFVNAFAGLITIIFKLYCIRSYTTQRINWHYFEKEEFQEVIGFSGWVTIIALAQRCIFNLAPSILGALSGSTAIAILGIAITLEGYTYTFANAINGMFLSKVSRIVINGDGDVLSLMIRVGRLQIYVVGLIVIGIICLGQQFIHLWVGNGFAESYLCAVLIIIPSFFHLPQMIGIETIYVKNKVKKMAFIQIIMAFFNLLGAIFLSPYIGALGIGISVFIAYMIRTVGMDIIFYSDLQIDLLTFFRKTFLEMSLPLFLCLILGYVCGYIIPFSSWNGFILKVIIFVGGFILIMYKLSMNEEEKKLVIEPIRKIIFKR